MSLVTAVPHSPASLHDDPPPFAVDRVEADRGHRLHMQQSGTPGGLPVLVLHGGPGSGASPLLRRFLDPRRWRIVCPDQRGAGRSTPRGATHANTTADLVADMCALRRRLGIERWVVVGGSWGATLAIAYAAAEPEAIAGLLLRGSFLARRADVDAFFAGHLPLADRAAALGSDDPARCRAAALDWWRLEAQRAGTGGAPPTDEATVAALVDRYRVQAHFLLHDCWLANPSLLDLAVAVPRVPTLLLHGALDAVCPPEGARALHARLPGSMLRVIDGAGHDPSHPAMAAAMCGALAHFADHGTFTDPPGPERPR